MKGDSATKLQGIATPFWLARFGGGRGVLILIVAAGIWAFIALDLTWGNLWPDADRWSKIGRFIAAAFTPALDYESTPPPDTNPLLLKAFYAAITTVIFAVTATSLSLAIGFALAFFGSTAWYSNDAVRTRTPLQTINRAFRWVTFYVAARLLIVLSRSTHELIWAAVFTVALGLNNVTALLAIVIPYSGTFGKVFSELIDECPRDAADVLRNNGATSLSVFAFGLLPRALPDMIAYGLYRFECALRSSAVLGFFGITTLGSYIHTSFEQLYFHEVWTYLYALIILVIAVELWSGGVRRRIVE